MTTELMASDLMGSAFASFLGHRKAITLSYSAPSQQVPPPPSAPFSASWSTSASTTGTIAYVCDSQSDDYDYSNYHSASTTSAKRPRTVTSLQAPNSSFERREETYYGSQGNNVFIPETTKIDSALNDSYPKNQHQPLHQVHEPIGQKQESCTVPSIGSHEMQHQAVTDRQHVASQQQNSQIFAHNSHQTPASFQVPNADPKEFHRFTDLQTQALHNFKTEGGSPNYTPMRSDISESVNRASLPIITPARFAPIQSSAASAIPIRKADGGVTKKPISKRRARATASPTATTTNTKATTAVRTSAAAISKRTNTTECTQCKMVFHTSAELRAHRQTAHARPFGCMVSGCAATFSKANHLSRHVRIVHNKERPFACTVPGCGSKFGSKSHLGDHTRAVHMRLRTFKCTLCNASWSKRFNLQKHIRIRHLGEKPYRCSLCAMSFGTLSHVTRHEATVHKKK